MMMPKYLNSLFIFRRDLRLHDNTALCEALRLSERVIPCFIFDPRQIEAHAYQSKPGLQFMLQSIQDLKRQLNSADGELALYHGLPEQVIQNLSGQHAIQAVFINRDYTPFSLKRDTAIAAVCRQIGIQLHVLPDSLLNEPEQILKKDKTPYQVFSAFYQAAGRLPVALPKALDGPSFLNIKSDFEIVPPNNMDLKAGRHQALKIMNRLDAYIDYQNKRDFPALDATSKLSAHLKFGNCSVREIYHAIAQQLGHEHPLIRQLYWRDFFTHIAYHFPSVFGRAFLKKFDALHWDNNPDYFQAWREGKTGFPIVDAGMRELNATGFMHNRARMITASFLIKDLHIDWRWGERYFAERLIDYDPCINNGNWQWAASTGCDAQPYFRIFNPWLQQIKFDKDCRYIYRWLPELKGFPAQKIHQWHKQHSACDYPAPIIDHAVESQISKQRFNLKTSVSHGSTRTHTD